MTPTSNSRSLDLEAKPFAPHAGEVADDQDEFTEIFAKPVRAADVLVERAMRKLALERSSRSGSFAAPRPLGPLPVPSPPPVRGALIPNAPNTERDESFPGVAVDGERVDFSELVPASHAPSLLPPSPSGFCLDLDLEGPPTAPVSQPVPLVRRAAPTPRSAPQVAPQASVEVATKDGSLRPVAMESAPMSLAGLLPEPSGLAVLREPRWPRKLVLAAVATLALSATIGLLGGRAVGSITSPTAAAVAVAPLEGALVLPEPAAPPVPVISLADLPMAPVAETPEAPASVKQPKVAQVPAGYRPLPETNGVMKPARANAPVAKVEAPKTADPVEAPAKKPAVQSLNDLD